MPRVSQAHAESRRAQITHAAAVCFAREGFHRTTMKQICAEAGLSAGSVYTWFPSKRSIIREMTRRRLASFRKVLATVRSDPREGLRLYLDTIRQAAAQPEIGRMNVQMVVEGHRDRFARDVMRTVAREGVAVLKQACRRISKSRKRSDADARARLLQAAAFGIVIQSLIDPEGDVASFELAERIILR